MFSLLINSYPRAEQGPNQLTPNLQTSGHRCWILVARSKDIFVYNLYPYSNNIPIREEPIKSQNVLTDDIVIVTKGNTIDDAASKL